MANRDLFYGDYQRQEERRGSALMSRLVLQGLVAMLFFAGVVALYDQEGRLGEGVRYVVALARADQQEVLAVNSLADVDWARLVDNLAGNATDVPDVDDVTDVPDVPTAAGDFVPGADYVDEAAKNVAGEAVLVLPTSGLLQAAFGDVGDDGLVVSGLEIFCQQEQAVKAVAIGKVQEAAAGRLVIEHAGGLETVYAGALTTEVTVGDVVQQGQVVGHLPEGVLTFQVLVEGEPVDPLNYVLGPE